MTPSRLASVGAAVLFTVGAAIGVPGQETKAGQKPEDDRKKADKMVGNRKQREWVVRAAKELQLMPTTEGAAI
jgi:hypothetical protein